SDQEYDGCPRRGWIYEASAVGRGTFDLRRRGAISRRGNAPCDLCRKGVWHGKLARLGSEGNAADGCTGRCGEFIRTNPSLEPCGHGRPAASIQGRAIGGIFEPGRYRDI